MCVSNQTSRVSIPSNERRAGALWGLFVGDALAMPVHWYYDRRALKRDYGELKDYVAPRNPHPDSYLGKASYQPLNAEADILHDQAQYWGQPGIHYHQFLRPGENTLNLKLAAELLESLAEDGGYHVENYLQRYLAFMRTPGRHRDTYVESAHRAFFQNYARRRDPLDCATENSDLGGLAALPALIAAIAPDEKSVRAAVRQHLAITHRGKEIEQAAESLTGLMLALLAGAELSGQIRRLPQAERFNWEELLNRDDAEVIGRTFTAGCPVSGSFPAVLYLALKYGTDFEKALIANTSLGGDNCHRGAVLGAILGAAQGQGAIPPRWLSGLWEHDRYRRLIDKLSQSVLGK